MSLRKPDPQRSFFDVAFLADDLFGRGDRYRLFREKALPALRGLRGVLAELYCEENGRPAIDPVTLAGVSLLQFMEKAPDRQAADRVRLHLGWKYALDLELDDPGFHATSLVKFRQRLLEGDKQRVVFDAVVEVLREAGLIKKRSKQRLDSTHVLGLVSMMTRLDVVRTTIACVLRTIAPQGTPADLPGGAVLRERYCESEVDWKRQGKAELTAKFSQAGRDALELIKWLRGQDGPLRDSDAAWVLERVFLEQYEWVGEGTRGRAKEGSGTVKNPHDPDAQWSTKDPKGKKGWVGYKAQVVETVAAQGVAKRKGEPTEQFITEVTTTEAIASDLDGMDRALGAQEAHGQEPPSELFVDAAYVSGDTLAESQEEGTELVGPARPCPSRAGELDVEQFDVAVSRRQAVCPAGRTSTQCSLIHDAHQGRSYYRFEWGRQCDACALRESCTRSKSGRRTVCVGTHHDLVQQRRREMKTDAFQKRMRQRNAIEGTISELTRLGLRRTRYRGLGKTSLANYLLGAACNVNRWVRLLAWQMEARASSR